MNIDTNPYACAICRTDCMGTDNIDRYGRSICPICSALGFANIDNIETAATVDIDKLIEDHFTL